MQSTWRKLTETIPAPFLGALLVALAFMGFIAWDQSYWWSRKDDYGFGWLVPAFVLYVLHDRWPRIRAALDVCQSAEAGRMRGGLEFLLKAAAYVCLLGGGLLFLAGAFYRAGAGSSYPGTLAITLGSIVVLFPLFFINAPTGGSARVASWRGDARVRLVGLFVFPVLVWLVSAPMVAVIETNVSVFLLNRVTTVVFFVFDVLGLPIEQRGNVLVLPSGEVGVADACSGIRSLTACLFAGSFLAAVFMEKLWKKVALVVCSMVFAFLTNLMRGIFLTSWAYNHGPEAIEGTVHDAAGYAVLGLTVLGLLSLLPLFNLKVTFSDHDDAPGRG